MTSRGLRRALATDPHGVASVLELAPRLGVSRRELAYVVDRESSWEPTARNPDTGAVGLLQWIPSTLRLYGASPAQVRAMPRARQAELVWRYLAPFAGRFRRPGELYLTIAGPSLRGAPDDRVVGPVGGRVWTENPGWRSRGGGPVTVGAIRAYGTPPSSWELPPGAEGAEGAPELGAFPLALLLLLL